MNGDVVGVESPGSEQLQTFNGHFDHQFIGQVKGCPHWVTVNDKDVHGGLEQMSLV